MDKITKLSQAIRLGATFRPQCRHLYFEEVAEGVLGSCAIGAAHEALSGEVQADEGLFGDLALRFKIPIVTMQEVTRRNDGIFGFDPHTREQIADWLEGQGL